MKRDTKQARRQSGFTLVELLFVIAIIAILSTLSLLVLRGAQDEARHGATESRVAQIKALLQQRLEDYEVRKLPVRLDLYTTNRSELRELKQLILADIISCEMPRDEVHVQAFPSSELQAGIMAIAARTPPGDVFNAPQATNLINELQQPKMMPALARRFVRPSDPIPNPPTPANLNSEYLYGVLALTDFDGSPGIEALGSAAIADTDGDGYLEVIDAFGAPIEFDILDPALNPIPQSTAVDLTQLVIHVESEHAHSHAD